MNITNTIAANLCLIEHLNAGTAPTLFRLKEKTSIFDHLRGFMLHMLSYRYPFWPKQQPRFYLFSKQHLQEWCRQQGIPGSIVAWQSHLIFLADCKLITFYRPTGPSDDPVLDSIWKASAARRAPYRHAETLWSVPPYTPERITYAESVAAEYVRCRANLTHLTKEDVIRVRGQAIANQLYLDGRTQSEETQFVWAEAVDSIRFQIKTKNYARIEDTLDDIKRAVSEKLRAEPGHLPYEQYGRYFWTKEKLLRSKQSLAATCQCVYRPSTKEEREILGLSPDYAKWLFLPMDGFVLADPTGFYKMLFPKRLLRKAGAMYVPVFRPGLDRASLPGGPVTIC